MFRTPYRRGVVLAALPSVLLVATFANAGSNGPGAAPNAGPDGAIGVTITHTTAGDALAGTNGMTLYVFAEDSGGTSSCTTGRCARNWPAFEGEASQVRPASDVSGTFTTTSWGDGTRQIVHNGQPLYYYAGDGIPGDASGLKPGGAWLLAPVGDSSACQPVTPESDPSPTFDAPGPARHASESSNGEY
jgi:predicted lipoprotein with Yx(FWY)xxD motif